MDIAALTFNILNYPDIIIFCNFMDEIIAHICYGKNYMIFLSNRVFDIIQASIETIKLEHHILVVEIR